MNAVITGATKGIGKACAQKFSDMQSHIAVCARTKNDLLELKKELTAKNNCNVFIKTCDVSKKDEVTAFGKFALENLKTVDVLINNAGIFLPGNVYNEAGGTLEQLIETNVYSVYHLTRLIVPAMIKNKKGHIFNLCSVASINAYDKGGSYAISKFALLGFSKNLRHELKEMGIKVTAVIAGATLTESWMGTDLPDERFIPPEDIAEIIWSTCNLSASTVVEEILVRPQLGDI